MNPSQSTRSAIGHAAAAALLAIVVLPGCGDDESAQDRYCDAGESLRASIDSLANLDLVAEGTDGLDSAVGQVRDDLGELRDVASDAAADEVGALQQAVDDLEEAISTLGGEITSENVSAVDTAVRSVGSEAEAVYATLADC